MTWADRRCVVTGASAGIGQAVAAALARRGALVVGIARRFAGPPAAPRAGHVLEVGADVTDEAAVRAVFDAASPVDVLVYAAGESHFGPALAGTAAELREMLDTHVVGGFLCAREAVRSMRARGSGHIVYIGSIAVDETFADCAGYTAAKAAQAAFARVLREEVRACGVRVTELAVGAVDTPLWDRRPPVDRGAMLSAADVAEVVADVIAQPAIGIERVVLRPPGGNL